MRFASAVRMKLAVGRVCLVLVVACLVACLVVLASPAAGEESEADRTKALLDVVRKDADAEAWTKAVRELEAGTPDQREALYDLLGRMAEERHRVWKRAASRIDALAAKAVAGRTTEKRRLDWEAARASANEWLFDEDAFPDPGDRVVGGPMEGYRVAKQRGDEAIQAYRALRRALDGAVRPMVTLSEKRANRLLEACEKAAVGCRRVVAALPEERREGLDEPVPDPLALQFLGLARRRFAEVAKAYAQFPPGWRKLCLFHAYGRAVTAWNEKHTFRMEPGALAGLEIINDYRMALGISPVAYCERLARAARGHSKEMAERGYFSHRSPVPERATKEKRAALEGYHARIAECITGAGGGNAAIEFWKYDGGHHRDMIHPMYVESGFSTRGPAVYVTGRGEEGHVPGIRY